MSLFLFLIAMEGLNNMFNKTKVNGWIGGSEVARNTSESHEVSQLQYVDTLIFCGTDKDQLRYLRIILVPF